MKTRSRFYSSLGLLLLLNALVKPVWIFGIDRQVQNVVGTETYGVYFSLLGLSVVLSFLTDLGITSFFAQRIASQENEFYPLLGKMIRLKLLLCLVYGAVLFLMAALAGVTQWTVLFYVALIQIFTSLFLFFRGAVGARQWFRADAWLSVFDKFMMLLCCGPLLYYPAFKGSMHIELFLLLQTVSLGLATAIAFLILKRGARKSAVTQTFSTKQIAFKKIIPFGLITLLMAAHSRSDSFLLERLHPFGAYESGIYAAAYRLLDAANIGGYLVAAFLLPYLARQWNDRQNVDSVVLQCRHVLMMTAAGITAVALVFSGWIEQVLYDHPEDYASEVLCLCLPAITGYFLTHVYGTVLTATGRIRSFCYIVFAGFLLNIIMNLFLIPILGAKGSCLSALISQNAVGVFLLAYSRQKIETPLQVRSLLIYIFTGLGLFGFLSLGANTDFPEWILVMAAAISIVAIMIGTKMLDPGTLIRSWQSRTNK
jgi:O-antigen/teichoic acid export membrane protein